nr:hypothetical protein [Streptomyces hygroscopicus]
MDHRQVDAALDEFWRAEGYRLVDAGVGQGDFYTLYEEYNGWTVLDWTRGWEWDLRRRAQLHVSRVYDCPGLLAFLYDGDYWGYELFHHGAEVDHFVQQADADQGFFADRPVEGRPELLLEQFPELGLDLADARGYLTGYRVDDPAFDDFAWEDDDPRNSPVREGDGYGRFDGGALFDFLRFLGVKWHTGRDADPPAWRWFTTEPS